MKQEVKEKQGCEGPGINSLLSDLDLSKEMYEGIKSFEEKLATIRVEDNIEIRLESSKCIWFVDVINKDTKKVIAQTGMTSLICLLESLKNYGKQSAWKNLE